MKISGKTVDNKNVISGIGKFSDCIGLPLIFIIDELKKRNSVVDWCDYIDYSIEKQWNLEQTLSKIEESLIENPFEKEMILERISLYLMKKLESF